LALVFSERIFRNLKGGMWNDGRVVEEEWSPLVVVHKLHRLLGDDVHAVLGACQSGVALVVVRISTRWQLLVPRERRILRILERELLIVVPQICRIVTVCHSLAVVAEPAID